MGDVIVSAGARFQSDRLAFVAAGDGRLLEYWVGVPRSRLARPVYPVRPLLAPTALWEIARRIPLLGRHPEIHHLTYDAAAARRLRRLDGNARIVHGWAGYSRRTFRQARIMGARCVLERSCPHVEVQRALLEEESSLVGAPSPAFTGRTVEMMLEEYELADSIVVPSGYSRRSFEGPLAGKVHLAPLGVDHELFHPAPAAPSRRAPGGMRVLFVGGDPLRKGLAWLLRAWQRLPATGAELRLRTTIPDWLAPAARRCRGLTLLDYLSREQLVQEYQAADVVILPSVDEGFGMALIEGMTCGAVGVCTTNVGAGEMVTGSGVFRVPPRDAEALAEVLAQLLADSDLSERKRDAVQATMQLDWHSYYTTIRDGAWAGTIATTNSPATT